MSGERLPKNDQDSDSESESNNQQPVRSLGLDLGDACVYNLDGNRLGSLAQGTSSSTSEPSTTKREDNPFSFKHFLKNSSSSNTNYQSLGARPKVYRENRPRHVSPPGSPQQSPPTSRKVTEFSSALPDFVQDHLVIEQCLLDSKPSPKYDFVLPDFAQAHELHGNAATNSMDKASGAPIPLDLPGLSLGNSFPLDLPLAAGECDIKNTPPNEVGNSKSLPDFLTDGPVRNSAEGSLPISPSSPGADPREEFARCRNCIEVRTDLAMMRQRAMKAEDDAEKNNRRANAAENSVIRLKQELKTLKAQLRQLQSENQVLRASEGAAAGGTPPPIELHSHKLAQELRAAASTAEHSLRSLLTGVDNLRMMASTLENMHRIEEKPDRFSNFEDQSGPAL